MISFLNEADALTTIQRILEGTSTAKLAVAFWGNSAIDSLGLSRSGLNLEIVCNLDSRACNPNEIDKLRKL